MKMVPKNNSDLTFYVHKEKGVCNMFSGTFSIEWQLQANLKTFFFRPISSIGVLFVLLIVPVIVRAESGSLTLSVEEVKELGHMMIASEKSLLNIKIESEAWVERKASLDDPCEPWERTPIFVSCTAWFNGPPGNKARVDIHKEILEWQEGAAPYVERSYSKSFDGQYGRVVNHTMKYDNKSIFINEGERLANSPKILKSRWVGAFTGILFSYHYSDSQRGYPISQVAQMYVKDPNSSAKSEFKFNWEERDGENKLRIGFGIRKKNQRYHSYLLDPSRNFALLESKSVYIREDESEQVISVLKVSKLKKVTGAIWWPVEASIVRPSTNPKKPYERVVCRVSNVIADDPKFDDKIFTVPFPKGCLVNDKVNGTKYRVGQEQKIKEK